MHRLLLIGLAAASASLVMLRGALAGAPTTLPVPEPTTIVIVAGGIGMLAIARIARRNKARAARLR